MKWLSKIFGRAERCAEYKAAFEQLPNMRLGFPQTSRAKDADVVLWAKRIDMCPNHAYEILTRDLPEQTRVSFSFSGTNSTLKMAAREPSGKLICADARNFLTNKVVSEGSVENHTKGSGFGRILLRNEIDFFVHAGFKSMDFTCANKGQFTWAYSGLPINLGYRGDNEEISSKLKNDFLEFEDYLPEETQGEVWPYLQLKDKYDLFRIARHPASLPLDSRNEKTEAIVEKYIDANASKKLYQKDIWSGEHPVTVGRLLLSHIWKSHLDLRNKDELEMLKQNLGDLPSQTLGTATPKNNIRHP